MIQNKDNKPNKSPSLIREYIFTPQMIYTAIKFGATIYFNNELKENQLYEILSFTSVFGEATSNVMKFASSIDRLVNGETYFNKAINPGWLPFEAYTPKLLYHILKDSKKKQ